MDSDYDLFPNRVIYGTYIKTRSHKIETLQSKVAHLRLILEKDLKAADLKWSLFIAAAINFKYESCLKPYPPGFVKNDSKDMDKLLMIIADIPSLDIVLKKLDTSKTETLADSTDLLDLLFYVIVKLKDPLIKSIPFDSHESILSLVGSTLPNIKPHHIFEVLYSNEAAAEQNWKEMSKHKSIFYAFHGNKLEYFHSILNFGLQLQNKNKPTDHGIYLSRDLGATLPYSPFGYGWGASCLGGHLSCVALCEVIDAPNGINYQKPTCEGDIVYEYSSDKNVYKDFSTNDSQYIVTDCDLVRVRYLLVYAKQTSASSRVPDTHTLRKATGVRDWLSRHKLFSIMLGYGLMLATIGLANHHPVDYYYQILLKQLDIAYNKIMT